MTSTDLLYYIKLLKLDIPFSKEDVISNWRMEVLKNHPDVHNSEHKYNHIIRELNNARDKLLNSNLTDIFDKLSDNENVYNELSEKWNLLSKLLKVMKRLKTNYEK